MKKSLILSAIALAATFGVKAETVTYDFNTHGWFKYIQEDHGDPDDPFGFEPAATGNVYLITKYAQTPAGDNLHEKQADGTFRPIANRAISLEDGLLYSLTPDETCENGVLPANTPFLSWGQKNGPTNVVWMKGWGSLDSWQDANYNAAKEEDWVATQHAVSFGRLGTNGLVSRNDTYMQFPEVEAPCKVTLWLGAADESNSKQQNLRCKVTPVVNGEALEDESHIIEEAYGTYTQKRMYKFEYNYTGNGPVAFRVGPDGFTALHVYHLTFESGASGIEDIIANPAEDENAPIYNVLGIQVDENYKGIVIKNGKKYIQK